MTPKEKLREKFIRAVTSAAHDGYENYPCSDCEVVADDLLAAVEESYPRPYHITITPSDDQIRELADSLRGYYKGVFAYGCICGAIKNSQPQQYEGT